MATEEVRGGTEQLQRESNLPFEIVSEIENDDDARSCLRWVQKKSFGVNSGITMETFFLDKNV